MEYHFNTFIVTQNVENRHDYSAKYIIWTFKIFQVFNQKHTPYIQYHNTIRVLPLPHQAWHFHRSLLLPLLLCCHYQVIYITYSGRVWYIFTVDCIHLPMTWGIYISQIYCWNARALFLINVCKIISDYPSPGFSDWLSIHLLLDRVSLSWIVMRGE